MFQLTGTQTESIKDFSFDFFNCPTHLTESQRRRLQAAWEKQFKTSASTTSFPTVKLSIKADYVLKRLRTGWRLKHAHKTKRAWLEKFNEVRDQMNVEKLPNDAVVKELVKKGFIVKTGAGSYTGIADFEIV